MKLDLVTVGFGLDSIEPAAVVRRVRFVEGLSELCEADVILTLPKAIAATVKPGVKAKVAIARGLDDSNVRWICGIVRSVEHLDEGDGHSLQHPLLRVTVVPQVWRASLAVRSRSFIDASIDGVITKTMQELGVAVEGTASTTVHPLILQYQESDLALMFRLLEDAGVTHHVEHTEQTDTWKLFAADPAKSRAGAPRPLGWTSLIQGQSDEEGVVRAGRLDALTTKTFAVADIDRRVEKVTWEGTGARQGEALTQEMREPRRVQGDGAGKLALRIADERRAEQESFWLETSDLQLRGGERVAAELSRGDAEAGVTTELLVVRVEHEVELSEATTERPHLVYRNRVEAVTYKTPFRPARVTPRPTILAPQTGIVKSYVDGKHLEVTVAMDWGSASPIEIPVRMTQPIAGLNHGAVLLPHVESEVLVHFIDGVPERPVLLGALYHSAAAAPVTPGNAEGSSYQSRLLMLGKRGNTNVIEVDDAVENSEMIKMVAINDVDVKVGRNEKRAVEGTFEEAIKGDVTIELGAKRSTTVESDETYETNGNVSITVHKTGRVLVNQTLQMTADTKLSLISGNTRADFSPSAAKITVGPSVIEMTQSAMKLTVGGTVIELTMSGIKLSIGPTVAELTPGQMALAAPMVDINKGALKVL